MREAEELIKILRNYDSLFVGKYLMLEAADMIEKLMKENEALVNKQVEQLY